MRHSWVFVCHQRRPTFFVMILFNIWCLGLAKKNIKTFIGFWASPPCAQGFLLAWCSGVTPYSVQGDFMQCWGSTGSTAFKASWMLTFFWHAWSCSGLNPDSAQMAFSPDSSEHLTVVLRIEVGLTLVTVPGPALLLFLFVWKIVPI